ncbi:hypothetical protein KA005_05285 [bacterium]|nr:hypothetical protein [bacterium]
MKTKFKDGVYMRPSGNFLLLEKSRMGFFPFCQLRESRKLVSEGHITYAISEWNLKRKLKNCEYLGEL